LFVRYTMSIDIFLPPRKVLNYSLNSEFKLNIISSIKVVLVSATLPREVLQMTTKFMNDPIRYLIKLFKSIFLKTSLLLRILVKRDELTLEGIKQFFVAVEKVIIPSWNKDYSGTIMTLIFRKNGSLILSVIYTIPSQSHKLLSFATQEER
jgi:hypothetical protein